MQLSEIALVQYLKAKSPLYYGKVLELRESISNWLSYIPNTFPHYTRHTVEHSEEIILQISKLLFKENDFEQSVLRLSSIEVFIVIASAYLHDTGMVVSEEEKIKIMQSEQWQRYISGHGKKRWSEIESIRRENSIDPNIKHYIADLQTRFLIAEYIRRSHHIRAVDVLVQHHNLLGKFSFDDPALFKTIADVCVAHGLNHFELENSEKYPDRRDIRGEEVNVRFLAILLRLGDLLDMSYDRACLLLMNAACPLPADSLAHWTQYQRIVHRLTAWDKIELVARCNNQDEHRFLQDWCQWLVEEVNNASILMAKVNRHANWEVPVVSIGKSNPTIRIEPSETATYIPSEWKFELDHEAVLQRLIKDVYKNEKDFLKEILQNAFDATRCKLFDDLKNRGDRLPEYPNEVSIELRRNYPVNVRLDSLTVANPLSGEDCQKQLLTIEDFGIGMDTEVIKRYFLQVGRSYYKSEEFQRNYGFKPISQFGIGFLSVFAVSENVTVETLKKNITYTNEAIKLTLSGPKNYLLTERSMKTSSGTKISILLDVEFSPGELTNLITEWCRKVEFPIYVNEYGEETLIESEKCEDFICETVSPNQENKFIISVHPIKSEGIFGEIYVFNVLKDDVCRWDLWDWAKYAYAKSHPLAELPEMPEAVACIHGISFSKSNMHGPFSYRVDIRANSHKQNLSRQHLSIDDLLKNTEILRNMNDIVKEHLSNIERTNSVNIYDYILRVLKYIPQLLPYFRDQSLVRTYLFGEERLLSINEIIELNEIRVITDVSPGRLDKKRVAIDDVREIIKDAEIPTLLESDLYKFIDIINVFKNKNVRSIAKLDNEDFFLSAHWDNSPRLVVKTYIGRGLFGDGEFLVSSYHDEKIIGFRLHEYGSKKQLILNKNNELVKWILKIKTLIEERNLHALVNPFDKLIELLRAPILHGGYEHKDLHEQIKKWNEVPGIEEEYLPPQMQIKRSMFFGYDGLLSLDEVAVDKGK